MAVRHASATDAPGPPRSRELLHALVQHASDLILVVTPEGRIRDAAGAATDVLGEDARACIGRTLVEVVHPHDCVLLNGLLTGALSAGPGGTERVGWRMRHVRERQRRIGGDVARRIRSWNRRLSCRYW